MEIKIQSLNREISELKDKIEKEEAEDKLKNSRLRSLEKEAKDLEILINRNDVKLDNMLQILNQEYELTYEKGR